MCTILAICRTHIRVASWIVAFDLRQISLSPIGVMMNKTLSNDDAREVVKVLDKLVASNDSIRSVCDKAQKYAKKITHDEAKIEKIASKMVIMHYSNLTAAGGGISAIPGMIPFIGPILSIFGVAALDALVALKFELEMTLALSHLAGFDIDDNRERKLAFLLVCTSLEEAYDSEKEPSLKQIVDLAMSEFSTREMSKTLAKTVARVIVMMSSKKLVRFFPVIGIAIGASVNKVLSTRTGRECWRALKHRKNSQTK